MANMCPLLIVNCSFFFWQKFSFHQNISQFITMRTRWMIQALLNLLFIKLNFEYAKILINNYFIHLKIRFLLFRMCKIKPGEVICDPMCGSGVIPIQVCMILLILFYSEKWYCNLQYTHTVGTFVLINLLKWTLQLIEANRVHAFAYC